MKMSTFDKTLYIQRLLFACEHAAKFDSSPSESETCNYRNTLKEADKQLDETIQSITYALELKGFFPKIVEVGE